ncbi:MAG: glycosyltransferase [Candidatus Thorarchaeota archaeon]
MNVLITFTYGVSLEQWYNSGIIYRELELYKRLAQKHAKIYLLTYGDHKDFNYLDLLGEIKVVPVLKYLKSRFSLFQKLKTLFLPFRLKKLFSEIDIIKTNQMEGSFIACIAKLLYKKKLIIRCGWERLRTYISSYAIKEKKNYFKYLLNYIKIYLIEFIAYRLADYIVLTNPKDIEFIIKKFGLHNKKDKIKLFFNFIDIDKFKPLNLARKDKFVLYIGRLTKEKNLINLIKAFRDLDEFSLDVIGSGPLKSKLQKFAKGLGVHTNFLGVYPNNRLPEIINQYQIYILPSFYEGNPKTLLEAMSCEVACIGTNVIGINNIVKHKVSGFLCDTNPESIKNAILEVYNNQTLRLKISKNARKYVLENCSIHSISKKEYQLYKYILS